MAFALNHEEPIMAEGCLELPEDKILCTKSSGFLAFAFGTLVAASQVAAQPIPPNLNWFTRDTPAERGVLDGILPGGHKAFFQYSIARGLTVPGMGAGKVVSNVNLLTGQPTYSLPIGSIQVREALAFPITLNYAGGSRQLAHLDNRTAPTSWIGLGWSLEMPFVAVNHKGTVRTSDDFMYCNLGPFGGGQLLSKDGNSFYLASNPYVKISIVRETSGFYNGQISRWTFQFTDGKKLILGSSDNTRRYVRRTNSHVRATPFASSPSDRFIYQWDAASLEDFGGSNKLLFEFAPLMDTAWNNIPYVRESYVSKILWLNGTTEVERYEFLTLAKGAEEYVGYATGQAKDDQRLWETRYLNLIRCFKQNTLARYFDLNHTIVSKKRQLTGLQLWYPNTPWSDVMDQEWALTYQGATQHYMLNQVTHPNKRIDQFTYKEVNFTSTDGDQDHTEYRMLEPDNSTEIALPSDNAQLAKWSNESTCDDRFCYQIVKDGDDLPTTAGATKHYLHLEVRRNLGNHFDPTPGSGILRLKRGDATTTIGDWDVIPGGDYFMIVNRLKGMIELWEFNGISFVQHPVFDDYPRYGASGFNRPIRVHSHASYFVVHIIKNGSSPAEIIPVVRNASADWQTLNTNTAACNVDNKDVSGAPRHGERVRVAPNTANCLEWDRAENQMQIVTMPGLFLVAEFTTGIVAAYSMGVTGVGFSDISDSFVSTGSGTVGGPKPNNYASANTVRQLWGGSDYFIVHYTSVSGTTANHVDVWYFDGASFRMQGSERNSATPPKFFLSQEYFIQTKIEKDVFFWRRESAAGAVNFTRSATLVRGDGPTNSGKIVCRTYAQGFVVEYWPSAADANYPLKNTATGNFHSYFYHVHRSHTNGWVERTPNIWGLFNLTVSAADQVVTGLQYIDGSQGFCDPGDACTHSYVISKFQPENTTGPFGSWFAMPTIPNSVAQPHLVRQRVLSASARLALFSCIDVLSRRIEYKVFFFNGDDYFVPKNNWVVDNFTQSASLSTGPQDNISASFDYWSGTGWVREFNSMSLLPQFESVQIFMRGLPASRANFIIDKKTAPLTGLSSAFAGMEKGSRAIRHAGDTSSFTDIAYHPHNVAAWPSTLILPRLYRVTNRERAGNSSYRENTTTYHRYSDANGMPQFTVSALGPGPHRLAQTILHSTLYLPIQQISFAASTYPDTVALRTSTVTAPLNSVSPFTGLSPIASSRTAWATNFNITSTAIWRDEDQNLSDPNKKTGVTPTFNLNEGWLTTNEITARNSFNQVRETRVLRSAVSGDESFTTLFYEGLRSDPVGTVKNASMANCAVLMAENGNAGLSGKYDYEGKWPAQPGVAYNFNQAHTGGYGLTVTDNNGPTVDLTLQNVRRDKFGMRVSAWILATDASTPKLTLERFRSDGVELDQVDGQPIEGWVDFNRWQRWEAILPYEALIAGDRFNTQADFIRVRVGTGDPTGNSANKVHVDDIVVHPDNSFILLSTYDFRGNVTSNTGPDYRSRTIDYGVRGDAMGLRDEAMKGFGTGAYHKMGEN